MGSKVNHIAGLFSPFAYESVTVAAAVTALTSGTYNTSTQKAARAFITLETAQVRYRLDGGDPSSSAGHILNVGDVLVLSGPKEISAFRAYRTGGTSGVLKVTYGEC